MPSLHEAMLTKNKYFVNSMSLQFLRSAGQGLTITLILSEEN